jgi:hypothetical protein
MRMRWMALVAMVSVLAACSGNPEGPSDGGSGGGGGATTTCTQVAAGRTRAQGTMAGTINNVGWTADCLAVDLTNPNILAIAGADLATGNNFQTFGFAGVRALGTQTITAISPVNALLLQGSSGWNASLVQGSGTLVIASLTNNSAAGTFTFTLLPVAGTPATGTKTVNGSFNLTF